MNGQQGVSIDQLSRDDLVKIVQRSETVKREQGARIGALTTENYELYAALNELQAALNEANARAVVADGQQPNLE